MTLRFFLIMQVNAIDLLIEFIFIKKRYFSSLIHLKEMYFGEKKKYYFYSPTDSIEHAHTRERMRQVLMKKKSLKIQNFQ